MRHLGTVAGATVLKSQQIIAPVVKQVKQVAAMTTPVVTLPLHLVSVAVNGFKKKKEQWVDRKEERKRVGDNKVEEKEEEEEEEEEEERKKACQVIEF